MFHFSTRNALLPSAAMTILLGLSACGGGGGGGDPAPANTTTTNTTQLDAAAAAAAAATLTTTTTTTTQPATTPGPINITGLTDFRSTAPNTLVNFAAATPNTVVTKSITGLTAGDLVVGIDVRPVNGVMYAFARAKDTNGDPLGGASIYVINPDTGVASARLPLTGAVFDSSTSVSVDFNPTNSLMRVVTFQGQSVAVDVGTGVATAGPAIAGNTAAVAYSNSAVSATAPGTTFLYRIDNIAGDDLSTVAPDTGAITTVGPLGIAMTEVQAFDITGTTNQNAFAALRTTALGPHSLYRISLSSGTATLIGSPAASTIGTLPLVDIAIRP